MSKAPRIALFDVENAPSLGYFWGRTWETNIVNVAVPWFMLCFSYKWLGQSRVYTHSLREYPHYRKNLEDDTRLIKDLHRLFDEADVLIAHNGDRFDIRKSNARFIKAGLTPPSDYKTIDTLKAARRFFMFESNKLNDLGQFLRVGKKIPTTGFDLWKRVMAGNERAWVEMERYNRRDVVLLERVYKKLRPYISNHPNLDAYTEAGNCPSCMSSHIQRHGIRVCRNRKYQRFQCMNCATLFQGASIPREKRP